MKEFISKIKRYNLQTITVTQDLSDLKNISDDTAKSIVENCNVHIEIPVKGVRSGMGVNIVAPQKGVEVLYDPHKEDWNFVK
ncbi:TraM recognition domain-containing protein [Salmonella enterica]|nr:TraM recognition domain-containing protein [Salmonella enterica]EKE8077641.1 TraM recognition domain-containing protein [Salmonella enterica]